MKALLLVLAASVAVDGQDLRDYLMRRASDQLAMRRAKIAEIRTPADVAHRKSEVRAKILEKIGGLPRERGPLNLRRTGTLDRGAYRVEKIVFESMPRFYVTANLYVPQGKPGKLAAVLQPLGHAADGKVSYSYQVLSINLARLGFVVLTFDPIGQGERRIFWDGRLGASLVGLTTEEHQMVGAQSLLAGESAMRYRVWDAMRGIDLLQSLPEVDPQKIGVAGCSGGGTVTAFVAALDDRVQTAAPGCYITSWEDQLARTDSGAGPQDAEQQFPDQLLDGIDHADLITPMAPKPYLIASMAKDGFPIAGTEKTYMETRRVYRLLGAEDRLGWHIAPGNHGLYLLTREAIYAWMRRWLQGQPASAISEPETTVELVEDLLVTETGQVSTSLGGETASTSNIKRFSEIVPPRPRLSSVGDVEALRSRIGRDISRLARYRAPAGPVRWAERGRNQAGVTQIVYESGDGRHIPASLLVPDSARDRKRSVLYLNQAGRGAAGGAAELAALGYTVLAIDPSGIGEEAGKWGSVDRSQTSLPWLFGDDKTTWLALMVGRTMLGLRMEDIVRGLDVLADRQLLHGGHALAFGRGNVAIAALHAAAVDPRIDSVVADSAVASFQSIARTPIHRQIFDIVIPGVLGKYDLPDLVGSLAPRRVWIMDATPPLGEPMAQREARQVYRYAAEAYAACGSPENFQILRRKRAMSRSPGISESYPSLPWPPYTGKPSGARRLGNAKQPLSIPRLKPAIYGGCAASRARCTGLRE